ncbi:UTP--glucose-1-phosphate uridylyltransferase-like isoform X1 [Rhododendron vialii]|uniref:UTP--glucose-1-phosphate uridylyltransferase-like isoform X1 n=1 Tax=Rhododendron vialii TaxID=182163 RepID=UPI00265DCE2F|nr:UTP--glucose-1-phosphate uridylyltransferase-like isoform X1 [Rhododendron vialii]
MTIHSAVIQKLLSTNAHLGRRVAAHHFKIYTYGARNGVTIIDSDKTLICIRNACHFISNLVRQKGKFLFVNTNPLCDDIVDQMTKRIGCGADSSWRLGGFLTNSGSPKKFRSRNKKLHLGSTQPPDCVVIMDTERKSSVIFEADKLQIPIVGLVNSDMPWDVYKRITYPVPANDSVKFVYLFCNLITKTFLVEQKRFQEVDDKQLRLTKAENREESENLKQNMTSSSKDENPVIPYESLDLTSDDPLETKQLLDKLVVIKLNGALGTKMGFSGPRSATEVCNGLTYLDLIINQIESLNSKHGCNVPLILMNTIRTHDGTLKVVEKYSQKNIDILPLCQNQSHPVARGRDSEDESVLFDHHELFLSLKNTGTLGALLLQGKEYILVVKYDNLGTLIDSKILNHLIQNRIQYCTELSEMAQMPGKNSLKKSKLVDTGNLWMNLKGVKRLVETDGKNVENYPLSKSFDRAIDVNVPHSRFQPMMSTSDLFLFQSDLYSYGDSLIRNSARTNSLNPCIELGPEFEKLSDFQSRFKSIPSIIELDSLKVMGDVWFGTGITLKGKVTIIAKPGVKLEIPDGVVIENKEISDPSDI